MFTNHDYGACKAINKLLDDGTFPLQKKEGLAFTAVCKWAEQLEERLRVAAQRMKDLEAEVTQLQAKKKTVRKKKVD